MNLEEMTLDQPEWFKENQIIDVIFAEEYLKEHPMRRILGRLFTVDGPIEDEESIRSDVYNMISEYAPIGTARRAASLLEAVKVACYCDPLPIQQDRIHVANGTYFLEDGFTPDKAFCMNRLPVEYNADAPAPERWLQFLSELLYEEDIATLQEYMGYLLIPSTRAQKMLILIGKGGEGKSRIGCVLRKLFGDSMNTCSLQKIEVNRFARADLEFKLLSLDDDMQIEALPKTNIIKSLVTQEGKIDIERKGIQSVQRHLYSRFLCFSNGTLRAKNDSSYAFYRRQMVIYVKGRAEDRIDDPYLADKLCAESEGILLWALEGLRRLIANDFRFTIGDRAKRVVETAERQANSIHGFLSSGYVRFERKAEATTSALYAAFERWCSENEVEPCSHKDFSGGMKDVQSQYGIEWSKHIERGLRGFKGICLTERS